MDSLTTKYYNTAIDAFENYMAVYGSPSQAAQATIKETKLPEDFINAAIAYYFGLNGSLSIN